MNIIIVIIIIIVIVVFVVAQTMGIIMQTFLRHLTIERSSDGSSWEIIINLIFTTTL